MNNLHGVAEQIAQEISGGKWQNFNNAEQHPDACVAILDEFQKRVVGYHHIQYVKALTSAINRSNRVARLYTPTTKQYKTITSLG